MSRRYPNRPRLASDLFVPKVTRRPARRLRVPSPVSCSRKSRDSACPSALRAGKGALGAASGECGLPKGSEIEEPAARQADSPRPSERLGYWRGWLPGLARRRMTCADPALGLARAAAQLSRTQPAT